jgi:SagB-type dehydrogenase family enzyme
MFEHEEAKASLAINSYRTISPGPESIGIRTSGLKAEAIDDTRIGRIAEEFMLASRINRWDLEMALSVAEFFGDPMIETYGKLDQDTYPEGPVVDLPESEPARLSVDEAIRRRRSLRYFTGDSISLRQLAALLRNGGGVTARAEVSKSLGETITYWYRAAPSGGGLYPVELAVLSRDVAGLDRAVYRYAPRRDQLVRIGDEASADAVEASLSGDKEFQAGVRLAAAIVCFIAMPWRSMRKYGPRGMRFTLQEAGSIAENIHLTATALGLGTCDQSSFYDAEASAALDCDGVFRSVIHMMLVGTPS